MPERMSVELDLSAIWQLLVETKQITNVFRSSYGTLIEVGLRASPGGPEHYAVEVDSGKVIRTGVAERQLPDSDFLLQWNQYRSLKPQRPRLGLGRQPDQSGDPADCLFDCLDSTGPLSLLRRYSPIRARLKHYDWSAFHNAVPVDKDGHFLWVPMLPSGTSRSFPHWLQVLTLPLLEDFLALAVSSKNLLTMFNAMHAGASVNHIHYHSVHRDATTPIEKAPTVSYGPHHLLADYPASGLVYRDGAPVSDLWKAIDRFQGGGVPFNLIHAGQCTYLIPRNIEHEVVAEFPGGVLAGMELAGKPITTEQAYYEGADWSTIRGALYKSTLRTDDIRALLD